MRRVGPLTVILALLVGVVQFVGAPPAAALTLPAGFRLVDYPTGQAAYNLTNFAWLEDGGLLTSGKDGTIKFTPVGGSPRQLTKVPSVRAYGDHGFLGFALGNDYATTGRVYVTYDKGDPASTGYGMVEEWKASPAANPTGFTRTRTIIDGRSMSPRLTQEFRTHAIDSVVVAPDDTLYVSIGDDAANNGDPKTLRAQDLNQPFGKLLHLTADGRGIPTNPYYSSAAPKSWRSMVYASGFRNPFRFNLDPRSGIVHLGDVGWGKTEEINIIKPGDNAGWPCFEGKERPSFSASYSVCKALYAAGSAKMPLWTYPHVGGSSVTGGTHYTGTSYPTRYHDSYFFGDYSRRQIWTLQTDLRGRMTRTPEASGFASAAGSPVAFHPGPNGDITYADIATGEVRRLVYSPGNREPVAQFDSVTNADTRRVRFSAADSYDLDGDALSYSWNFGDGTSATGKTVEHTYGSDQAVEVTLTVRDQLGASDSAKTTVYPANHTPQLRLTAPAGRTYAVGDSVSLSATATDVEDGPLTVTWDTALLHCPFAGSCHLHPDGTSTGPNSRQAFTDHGADTTMLITARVVDSKGATVTATYEAKPRLRTLAVNSPVAVSINGEAATSVQVVAGSRVELNAPSTSSYLSFRDWNTRAAARHSFTMPDSDLTLTARYSTAIDAKYAQLGGSGSFLGRPTAAEYDVSGGRARNYAGGRIYWSSDTGAHEVRGLILNKYVAVGGPGRYGFPTSDEGAVSGGRRSTFEKARIYWSRPTGAHEVHGYILDKYVADGGPRRYGLPTTDEIGVTGGRASVFSRARIYWSAATGAHPVYGAILGKYASMGYHSSCLRLPTTDEYSVTGGRRSQFLGGSITYITGVGTTARC